jgi:hypothetical protein
MRIDPQHFGDRGACLVGQAQFGTRGGTPDMSRSPAWSKHCAFPQTGQRLVGLIQQQMTVTNKYSTMSPTFRWGNIRNTPATDAS